MPTFDTQKVEVATINRAKLDVSSTHITTSSFMYLQPVYYRHMLPQESLKGQGNVVSRLAPVAVPTYGRCRINMRSFFVPFRTIFPNWNEFITDTIGVNNANTSLVTGSPYFTSKDLMDLWFNNGSGSSLATAVTDASAIAAGAYDFVGSDGSYYAHNVLGRQILKILESLGYRVVWDNKSSGQGGPLTYSALGLLAYVKVYCDWYANQAYLDSAAYLNIQKFFKFNDPTSALHLLGSDLFNIFSFVNVVCYDNGNDVFVNAWDNPMAPNPGNYSAITGNDVSAMTLSSTPTTNNGFSVVLDSNGTPYMKQSAASSLSIGTEYLHSFLKAATDYVKRNQLSGAAAIDRFLARFGISLDAAKMNRSVYISAQSVDVDFGDVMQTANTAGAGNVSNLGDYAGRGFGSGQFAFDFKTEEYGIFLVVSSILPQARLYQGFDRNNTHIDKTQFWTPEFDNLGCSSITKGEVYVSRNGLYANGSQYEGVFGFAPRYYEYKQKTDYVTGDFVSPATMNGGDAWHLNRELNDGTFSTIANQTHSLNFTRGVDAFTYNRIFNYTNTEADMFYLVYHFDAMALAPCKSLFDTYDFDDAGRQLSMNGNSAKVN